MFISKRVLRAYRDKRDKPLAALVKVYKERMALNLYLSQRQKTESARREYILHANLYENVCNDLEQVQKEIYAKDNL